MEDEKIRNSFQKIKQDMDFLKEEITALREDFSSLLEGLTGFLGKNNLNHNSTDNYSFQAQINENSTDKPFFKPLNDQNRAFSTGNQGVPTDRQTDQQTDRHINNTQENSKNTIENALEMLDSLDALKKELRLKLKRLTSQEMLVFSAIYQIEEEKSEKVSYKSLSEKLGLTESSIRDYIGRLVKKGIPIDKTKLNNKNIVLSISPNLKKLASLSTILQ